MSFDRGAKRLFPYLLTFLFFLTMWLIKELQIIVNTGTVSSYLMTTNRYAFNYFDELMLSGMYIPLYLTFEYFLWQENSQIVIRFQSKIRYLGAQTLRLTLSTLLFWILFMLVGLVPVMFLPGTGMGTFVRLLIVQTMGYCLISLEIGVVMYWLFQLWPKLHLVMTLALAVLVIIYSGIPTEQMNLFQTIDVLNLFYAMHELSTLPITTLVGLLLAPLMTLCARVMFIQHEEFWQ